MSYIYGTPILDVSRSQTTTQQSVGLLWTSDQLVAETSTWQHTTLTTDKYPCPRWDSNPRSQQVSGRRCDLETSRMGAPYIYDISHLRVKNVYWSSRKVPVVLVRFCLHLNFSRQIFEKCSNVKFNKNLCSGSGVVPCGQTDRHDEANSCFSQFSERTWKWRLSRYKTLNLWFALIIYNQIHTFHFFSLENEEPNVGHETSLKDTHTQQTLLFHSHKDI